MDIETRFSKEGTKAIKQIVREELEDILKRLSRLEHKVYNLKAIPSKNKGGCNSSHL
jgi:hypothetical protein